MEQELEIGGVYLIEERDNFIKFPSFEEVEILKYSEKAVKFKILSGRYPSDQNPITKWVGKEGFYEQYKVIEKLS